MSEQGIEHTVIIRISTWDIDSDIDNSSPVLVTTSRDNEQLCYQLLT
jgi:hypothetical protein